MLRSIVPTNLSALLLALITFGGCAVAADDEHTEESLQTTRSELATSFGATNPDFKVTTPWTSPGTVNVCLVGPGGVLPAAADVAAVQEAVTNSWQAATGLTFQFSPTACPSPAPSDWISIFLNPGGDGCEPPKKNACAAGGGKNVYFNSIGGGHLDPADIDNRNDIQIYIPDVNSPGSGYELSIAHEVGHALGFNHEFRRSDNNSSCTSTNGTFDDVFLTTFDPESIMSFSYCLPNARSSDALLSGLDKLGGEIIYPRTNAIPIRGYHGFPTANGLVVRTDDVLVNDWSFRGAKPNVFGSFTWNVNQTLFHSTDLPVTALTGETDVWGTFTDFLGRSRTLDVTTVTPDNGLHAMFVVAVL